MYSFFKAMVTEMEFHGNITKAVFNGDHFSIEITDEDGKKISVWGNQEKETENNGN